MRAPIHDLHPSNLLSYLALFCGVAALGAALGAGNRHAAGALLATAALADTFDGRFARRFQRTPRQAETGAQLDNLVDASVFGIAPLGVLAALVQPGPGLESALWWGAAGVYALAVVTRLAFFHVEADPRAFVGVPTPAIALVWASELLWRPTPLATGATLIVASLAMVLPLAIPRPRGVALAAFALWAAALVALHLSWA